MSKRKVELDVVLPSDAAQCAACTKRLLASVSALPGVKSAHIDVDDATHPKLCLHYEPSSVRHERQARLVEGLLVRQPGVLHASVAFGSRRLFVEFDPTKTNRETLLRVASKAGIASYTESAAPAAAATEHDDHEHEHGGPFGERTELIFSLACGALTAIGWSLERAGVAAVVTTTLASCRFHCVERK